jgi:hypothetical protein
LLCFPPAILRYFIYKLALSFWIEKKRMATSATGHATLCNRVALSTAEAKNRPFRSLMDQFHWLQVEEKLMNFASSEARIASF